MQEILISVDMLKINLMLSETGLRTFNFGCSLIPALSHSVAPVSISIPFQSKLPTCMVISSMQRKVLK